MFESILSPIYIIPYLIGVCQYFRRNHDFYSGIPVKRSEAEEVLGNNYERIKSDETGIVFYYTGFSLVD